MISVLIPTYREPEYLDLCLKSCIEGQTQKNEIIVIVDGYYDENKEVLKKWSNDISIIDLEENRGLPYALNIGVYNTSNKWILMVNDDNVFLKNWDINLAPYLEFPKNVYSINQVEPNPSIFPQFIIKDYGQNASEFNLESFWNDFSIYKPDFNLNGSGGTLPILITKENYLGVGGWDEHYPTNGVVADWDFFFKCEKVNLDLKRIYNVVFYHFSKVATGNNRENTEITGHNYFYYKWKEGYIPKALRS
jgi:glycosyltransferase involved in cell wall biosynthesis